MSHTLRSPYNFDANLNSERSALSFELPSLASQDSLNESDINYIVERFGVTGRLPVLPVPPEYVEANFYGNFHEAMNFVAETHEIFDAQPSHIREKFANDPQLMLDYLNDPAYADDSVRIGLREVIPPDVKETSSAPPSGGTDA